MSTKHKDQRTVSYEVAEATIGRRLDRRRSYAVIDGRVHSLVKWSQCCSGCCEGYEYGCSGNGCHGGGCHECGYTGRTRREEWVPINMDEASASTSDEQVLETA